MYLMHTGFEHTDTLLLFAKREDRSEKLTRWRDNGDTERETKGVRHIFGLMRVASDADTATRKAEQQVGFIGTL